MPIYYYTFFFKSSMYILSITASNVLPLHQNGSDLVFFQLVICLHRALWTEEQSNLSVHGADYIKGDTDLVAALLDWQNTRGQITRFRLPRHFRHSAHATPDMKLRSDIIVALWLTAETETVRLTHAKNMWNQRRKWDNAFYVAPLACNFPG